MQEWILLEDRKNIEKSAFYFENSLQDIIAWHVSELDACFQLIHEYQKKGYYLVGFLSFELGYIFHQIAVPEITIPLLHFKVYKNFSFLSSQEVDSFLNASNINILKNQLKWNFDEYQCAFKQVKKSIFNGESYQVNLTSKYHFQYTGSPVALYKKLRTRQKVSYSGLLNFNDYQILTLSPELFFVKNGSKLKVKPMKGTVKRGANDIQDLEYKRWLLNDVKSKAENTMIVDLLRNDLAMISVPGSVCVSELLSIESYETVHQMVSTIESRVDSNLCFESIIRALFPCGSITGAPKRRTLEIIRGIEAESRGIYTGAIGYIMPNNDMCFNVSIRTLFLNDGKGELGVGGGIVYDSHELDEYEELQIKGSFFTDMIL